MSESIKEVMANTVEHLDKRPFDLRGAKLSQQIKAIQWPDVPEQINPAFIDDIANKVAQATGIKAAIINKEISATVVEHYKDKEQKPHE